MSTAPIVNTIVKEPVVTTELAHITQEMYKKNFELADKNKTLALLRKIDEIILSSVTDTHQIAQQVADSVVSEEEFKAVVIYMVNKDTDNLICQAVSATEPIKNARIKFNTKLFREVIPFTEMTNELVHAVVQKQMAVTHTNHSVLSQNFSIQDIVIINEMLQIKSSIIYPLIAHSEVIGVIFISLGETEEKLTPLQKELITRISDLVGIAIENALLYAKIEDANAKLKQLDKLKDEFVSLASHELRTPMTVIKSYLWMVLQGRGGDLSDKQKFYLDRAYKSTDRLIAFVNDMLNVSRIESNRFAVNMKSLDFQVLTGEIVSELDTRAQELGLNITLVPYPSLPHVLIDPDKIREVFTNIIGNAFKFTPRGGHVTISFSRTDGMVEVHIADTGPGISIEDQAKLFQKFGMVGDNNLVRQNTQGTGLGLYLSKSIVELHGGKIWVYSAGKGKGTTFNFTVKIVDASNVPG